MSDTIIGWIAAGALVLAVILPEPHQDPRYYMLARAHLNLGVALAKQGQLEEARDEWLKVWWYEEGQGTYHFKAAVNLSRYYERQEPETSTYWAERAREIKERKEEI